MMCIWGMLYHHNKKWKFWKATNIIVTSKRAGGRTDFRTAKHHNNKQQTQNTTEHNDTMTAEVLMVDQDDAADADLLLQEYDFPDNYVNMAHPEDGTVQADPITPQFIRHSRRGHFRMLVRISLRLGEKSFVPYTFVCDTGAPIHIYLSEPALKVLETAGRIDTDELGSLFVTIEGRKAAIRVTPHTHQPGNILGMLMLERFGLQMSEGSFTFSTPVAYI